MRTGRETGLHSTQVYNTWKEAGRGNETEKKFKRCSFCNGLGYRRSRIEKKQPEECPKCKGWGMFKDS